MRRDLSRLRSWRARLGRYLAVEAGRPFAWGESDCVLFAAGAVEAMTGVDPAAPWRGRYRTERGAWRVLRRAGFRDHLEAAAAVLPQIPAGAAREGDLAVVGEGREATIGIIVRDHVVCRADTGVRLVSRRQASRAFRCG